jgi:hypothetical protein
MFTQTQTHFPLVYILRFCFVTYHFLPLNLELNLKLLRVVYQSNTHQYQMQSIPTSNFLHYCGYIIKQNKIIEFFTQSLIMIWIVFWFIPLISNLDVLRWTTHHWHLPFIFITTWIDLLHERIQLLVIHMYRWFINIVDQIRFSNHFYSMTFLKKYFQEFSNPNK